MFRRMRRGDTVGAGRLTAQPVALIVKRRRQRRRTSAATNSTMPSTRMNIPKITASVARLLLGLAITMTPATMLTTPISRASHQPQVS